jgi:hypothetical protein
MVASEPLASNSAVAGRSRSETLAKKGPQWINRAGSPIPTELMRHNNASRRAFAKSAEPKMGGIVEVAPHNWSFQQVAAPTGVSAPGATGGEPTETANANAVQLVDPNEVNDLDRAAAATVSTESSWSSYLLLILGGALAAASATWFFAKRHPCTRAE